MKKFVVDYISMKPEKRSKSYGVQKKIADKSVIPHRYLRQRALRVSAFTDDRRGFEAAFKSTVAALISEGVLYRMSEDRVSMEFGLRCTLYGITGPTQAYPVKGVGYVEEVDLEAWSAGLGLGGRK